MYSQGRVTWGDSKVVGSGESGQGAVAAARSGAQRLLRDRKWGWWVVGHPGRRHPHRAVAVRGAYGQGCARARRGGSAQPARCRRQTAGARHRKWRIMAPTPLEKPVSAPKSVKIGSDLGSSALQNQIPVFSATQACRAASSRSGEPPKLSGDGCLAAAEPRHARRRCLVNAVKPGICTSNGSRSNCRAPLRAAARPTRRYRGFERSLWP